MHNLIRLYNQNRFKIWVIVIVIIIGFTMIRILNSVANDRNNKNNKNIIEQEQIEKNTKTYRNESESMVSGGAVSENNQKKYGNLIDEFLGFCINGQPEKAYDLLSSDCKKVLYPSEKIFETQYYNNKFNGMKTYSFQSWSSSKDDIYLVKIFDNMLSTGKDNTENYLQDYITVVFEDNNYKLNISGFIAIRDIQKSSTKNGISIYVKDSYCYMDYQIYNIEVSNTTDNTICLVNMSDNNSIYIQDQNNVKFQALLNENIDDDFILKSGEKKSIQLKFSNSYIVGNLIDEINFSNVIMDYERYEQNSQNYTNIISILIEL